MSLDWIRVSLRGYGGEAPTGRAFFDLLELDDKCGMPLLPGDSPGQAALVELLEVAMQDLTQFNEPSEEFAARVRRGLQQAAKWLDSVPSGALDRWRAEGLTADVFVGGWLDNEQFDLNFPSEFLLACGRLGLPISICTND